MDKVKLYCYADETGLETSGKFFLVSVVVVEAIWKDELEQCLEAIEKSTKKNFGKWAKSSIAVRQRFLEDISHVAYLRHTVFYSRYIDAKNYPYLTALSIAKALEAREEQQYTVKIIIDALTQREKEKIRKYLKQLHVKYDSIHGLKDEQSVCLRLADSMAGFARDYIEGQSYTQGVGRRLTADGIISEV